MTTRVHDRNPYFPLHVKALRKQFGLNQEELGKAIGIKSKHPAAVVSGWERGEREPSFNQLCKLASLFGVTTDFLLGRENSNPFVQHLTYLVVRADEQLDDEEKKRLTDVIQAFINSQ